MAAYELGTEGLITTTAFVQGSDFRGEETAFSRDAFSLARFEKLVNN